MKDWKKINNIVYDLIAKEKLEHFDIIRLIEDIIIYSNYKKIINENDIKVLKKIIKQFINDNDFCIKKYLKQKIIIETNETKRKFYEELLKEIE